MKLHGPAHPDQFRVKVGRWGERHYSDPLPADQIAPATSDVWPSVTTIKKAAGKDWSWTSLERAATYLAEKRGELDGMNTSEIHNRLLDVNRAGLTRAGNRGSDIHSLIEARSVGGTFLVEDDAKPYIPAVDRFLDDCQPEWLFSEVVIINRTLGYGGTADAGVIINMPGIGRVLVDWKTRRSAAKHAAYDEERWQVAAYMHGQYMIVDRDGQAERQPLPELDGGLIVSLAPEGYKLFPVDLDQSWITFQILVEFWYAKQEHHPIRPLHVKPATPEAPTVDNLRDRCNRIKQLGGEPYAALLTGWPAGVNLKNWPTRIERNQVADLLFMIESQITIQQAS